MHPLSRLKADLFLVFVAMIWGSAFIAQSIVSKSGIAFLHNGACFVIASLLLLPLIKKSTIVSRTQWKWMIAAGALLFGGSACQQVGLYYTRVANAGFLTTIYVIFTPFLLWAVYGEKARRFDIFAALLALVGAFLLSTGGSMQWQPGDALEVLGAVFWGLHLVLIAKHASSFDSISFACGQFMVCGLLNFVVGFFFESTATLFLWPVIWATLYRAVFSIGIGYTVQVWAQKFTRANDAALIFSLEAVFAALIAWLILGESLLGVQIFGCALILLAAFTPQFVKTEKI